MLVVNSSQVVFSGQCIGPDMEEPYAYFDASYDGTHMYLSMTIYEDNPLIMEDFAEFKDGVVSTRENQGVIQFEEPTSEEEEPIEENPEEE